MRIATTPIALGTFLLVLTVADAPAADREIRSAPTSQIALQPTASTDVNQATAPNCLLPGQIRNFGGLTILTPRRTVTLPAADCTVRGGELIASAPAVD
jgi:hypothetical protein